MGTDSPNGVASRRIVSVSASYLYDFCVTVGTATRTAGILIHNRLKALAVNSVSYTHLTLPTILRV